MPYCKIGELIDNVLVQKIEDALNADSPALSKIKKERGEIFTIELLEALIIDLVLFFNLGKQMNTSQTKETAKLIYEDFWMLKLEDLVLCFKNVKKGKYGKIESSLDGTKIYEWVNIYISERFEVVEQIEEKKKIDYESIYFADPIFSEKIKEIINQLPKANMPEISILNTQESNNTIPIDKWYSQFKNIAKKYPAISNGKIVDGFISYKGIIYSWDLFYKKKYQLHYL